MSNCPQTASQPTQSPCHTSLPPQLSVLRVFYGLLADPDLRSPAKLRDYREVLSFAAGVVRSLFRKLVPEKYYTDPRDKGGEGEAREAEGEQEGQRGAEEGARKAKRKEMIAEVGRRTEWGSRHAGGLLCETFGQ